MTSTVLSHDPKIILQDSFISIEDCNHIIEQSKSSLQQSVVANQKGPGISNGRKSQNTWLSHKTSPIINNICRKISSLVDIPLTHAEKLQVVYYNEGGLYNPHYDCWDHDNSEKQRRMMKYGGQRILTAILYLNNVEDGGETHFPKKNITIQPQIGNLLCFSNCKNNTFIKHPDSLHAGMPVSKGEKWICNLWFREMPYSQLYKFEPLLLPPPPPIIEKTTDRFISRLEEGDILPFVEYKNFQDRSIKLYNYVENKDILIICTDNFDLIENKTLNNYTSLYHVLILTNNSESNRSICTNDNSIVKYFGIPEDGISLFLLNPERRVIYKKELKGLSIPGSFDVVDNLKTGHVPYLVIKNVFNQEILDKLISEFEKNKNHIDHNTPTKNRQHIHPDSTFEREIDVKLSKTLFQKVWDTFHFNVKYRELYKICCYDSQTNGRFHAHRDTVEPYTHREFGVSIVLNSEYLGGELEFVEYGIKLKPEANTAVVFPGIYTHKVHPVYEGKRYAVITFLCKEVEGKTKDSPQYMVKC